MKIVIKQQLSTEFIISVSKVGGTSIFVVKMKLLISEYQLVFEVINKVFLQRSDETTIVSFFDLLFIFGLSKLELMSFLALMIKPIHTVEYENKEKHGMPYGY